MTRFISVYENAKDAQDVLNMFTQQGLDDDNLSLIMIDVAKAGDVQDDRVELDEENLDETEITGVIDPIESMSLNGTAVDGIGVGDYLVAGKLMETIEVDSDQTTSLDQILMDLGIEEADVQAYENRIKAGQVLATITVTDENLVEEYRNTLSTVDPVVFDEFTN